VKSLKFKRDSYATYEISNEQTVSTKYKQDDKTMTIELPTNSEAETNYYDAEEGKILDEQNLNGKTDNNMQVIILDEAKNSRQSSRKSSYLMYVTLKLNILISLFVFIVLNACKINVYNIVVHAIVYLGMCCVWNFMYSVEDMVNTLDDCDRLEKVIDLTNVHKHNDVMVTIKVQQFRSRYAKYVH